MINAREWLDKHYPTKEARKNVQLLDLTNLNLTGELDVTDFSSDAKVIITGNPNLGEIKDEKKEYTQGGTKILYGAQEFIEVNCDTSAQELNLFQKNLSGSVDFSKFTQLTKLNCPFNQLVALTLNCPNLIDLNCSYNQLAELNISNCSKLTTLDCSGNQFAFLDLTHCSQLIKLKCSSDQLTILDLSNSPNLTELSFGGEKLSYVLVSTNCLDKLTKFDCGRTTKFYEELVLYGHNYRA